MKEPTLAYVRASEFAALKRKCQMLMLMVLGIFMLWLVTALPLFGDPVNAHGKNSSTAALPVTRVESLRVREIVVVDANETPRVRIAAPLPDPIMLGKRSKRGGAVSGLLLYDAEGNERGGYVTDEKRNVALTLDEINRAAVHIGVNDRGEMHFALSNGLGGFVGMGVIPTGGWFRIEKPGQPSTLLPNANQGERK